jgi:hypothetical protein
MLIQSTSRCSSLRLQRRLSHALAPSLSASVSTGRCDRPSRGCPRGFLNSFDNTSTSQHKFSTLSHTPRRCTYLRQQSRPANSLRLAQKTVSHSTKAPSSSTVAHASSQIDEAKATMGSGKCSKTLALLNELSPWEPTMHTPSPDPQMCIYNY